MSDSKKRYTLTAALPYTNGPIHIGHLAGVYVPADIYARYLRLIGKDVAFIGGSDEHGVVADPNGALKVNDKLKLVPGHCDPTCNVHDWYVGVRGGKVETLWPVSARGKAY